jgi:hypothetical protein
VTPSSAPALDRVLVIVPAWNEEATLGAVLAQIHAAIAAAGLPADMLGVAHWNRCDACPR